MPAPLSSSNEKHIGRFQVLRTLGRGAEGVVYLAHDPKLGREVAIKTLSLGRSPNPQLAQLLLSTARTASTLSHPNIVSVFEADMHEGSPFVVYEYVEGSSLAQMIAADGPLPMARAVVMMSQILAGVALMHERSLIHGDIKPENILVAKAGLARVADFGLLRHQHATDIDPSSGTVRYMAPECFDGSTTDCRRDIFALGLVFHEMLTGEPIVPRGTARESVHIFNEIVDPPSAKNARIAVEIDAIIMTALRKDPAERFANAGQMKLELDRFRVPNSARESVDLREQNVHSTVEFLVRRMAHKSDFPALSESFSRINRISAQADDASIKTLSDTVMRDFALTQKLLRLVNSAANGNLKITKVSQAITMLGVGQLRAMATAMMLSNRASSDKTPEIAAALTDAFVAGLISRNIGRMNGLAAVEELFICGMFSALGELLALYYLAEEHAEISRRVTYDMVEPNAAARSVLGLTLSELGIGIARHWQFPSTIINALAPLPPGPLASARTLDERMWHCAAYAQELCTLARRSENDTREAAFEAHINRFANSIPVGSAAVRELLTHSVGAAGNYSSAAGLAVSKTLMVEGMRSLCYPSVSETPAGAASTAPESQDADAGTPCTSEQPATQVIARCEPAEAASPPGLRAHLTRAWRGLF